MPKSISGLPWRKWKDSCAAPGLPGTRVHFRLRNAQQNVRGLPQQVLHQSVHLLLEADLALKSSRLDGRILLEELVAKLLLAAQGDRS